jgi:hypothetical protein
MDNPGLNDSPDPLSMGPGSERFGPTRTASFADIDLAEARVETERT